MYKKCDLIMFTFCRINSADIIKQNSGGKAVNSK